MPRVLVVDEDPSVRQLLEVNARSHGHEVQTTATAEDALLIIAESRPDLLLLDVELPGLDGVTLVRWLDRGLGRPHRICLVSGLEPDALRVLAEEHHVEFLPKPFDVEALDAVLTLPALIRDPG